MAHILQVGNVNLEMNFCLPEGKGFADLAIYQPISFCNHRISLALGGAGFNVANVLRRLGNSVSLASLIGSDWTGRQFPSELASRGIGCLLHEIGNRTSRALVITEPDGRRQIFSDMADLLSGSYPVSQLEADLEKCAVVAAANVPYAQAIMEEARQRKKLIATDVQALDNLSALATNQYIALADIVFLSHEKLTAARPEQIAAQIFDAHSRVRIVGIGLGASGAFVATRRKKWLLPAAQLPGTIITTLGAGDALFAGFLHDYLRHRNPAQAMRFATAVAAHRICSAGSDDFRFPD